MLCDLISISRSVFLPNLVLRAYAVALKELGHLDRLFRPIFFFFFYNLVSGLGNPRKNKCQHLEYSGVTSRLFDATI